MADPTGILDGAAHKLRDYLAGTLAFQAWTDTATAEEAKEHIHMVSADGAVAVGDRPFAVVSQVQEFSYPKGAVGGGRSASGIVVLSFEADVTPAYADPADAYEASKVFTSSLGNVLVELAAAVDATGEHVANDFALEQITRGDENAKPGEGDYFRAQFAVPYGLMREVG